MKIEFFVPSNPQALKRHRMFRRANFVGSYDPSKNDKADFLAKSMQHKPTTPLMGSLELRCEFRFSRPSSHYGTGRNKNIIKPAYQGIFKDSKPDIDNLFKFILDALNGVFWVDDRQVSVIHAGKYFIDVFKNESSGVQITITQIQ